MRNEQLKREETNLPTNKDRFPLYFSQCTNLCTNDAEKQPLAPTAALFVKGLILRPYNLATK